MRNFGISSKYAFLSFLILLSAIFCSCGPREAPKLVIGQDFYYWESGPDANFGDALKNTREFKKLEDYTVHNLRHVLGKGSHYVWIRADFEIPPEFKNQPLSLIIPNMRFAAQLFCNGNMVSQQGNFPPHEQSTLFKAHFFSFPLTMLHQEGKNTILIRVYATGRSGISSHAFIQPTRFGYFSHEVINFHHTRIYMFLLGSLLLTFILYMCLYLSIKKFKEFRDFALVNLFSSIFLIPFFATELPIYTSGIIPYMLFYKFTFCIPTYLTAFFAALFVANYFSSSFSKPVRIIRLSILVIQILLTISTTTYDSLIDITTTTLILLVIQIIIGISFLIRQFFCPEHKKTAIQISIAFAPFIATIIIDLLLRNLDRTKVYPYFSIFGWQFSIVIFIILLSIRFASVYKHNERLSNHLAEEVTSRTSELQVANKELETLNEQLAKDKHRSDMDLEMASLVQRNFFPRPNKTFRGWEISVCYSPQSKVSGDFYDYYNYNDILNGISLFDVSGHGLSASLVTMLSKNIISRVFQTGFRRNEPVDRVLTKINNMIISEKGDIDNYMTGILCRFNDVEDSSKCSVELGNAGHPYPLKFSVHDKEVYELKGNDGKKHYGAIGMKGINVSFARSNFFMATGDILVLYTDGITEATNSKQEQFGLSYIKDILKKNHARPSGELIGLIIDKLEEFTEYKPYEDDITLIIAKRKNPGEYVYEEEFDEHIDDTVEELSPPEEDE